jgi:phosphoribosyl-AMP cyclohydrolase
MNLTIIKQSITDLEILSVTESNEDWKQYPNSLLDCDKDSLIHFTDSVQKENRIEIFKEVELEDKLYPVVTLDKDNKVLMQAFLNAKALAKTFETGYAHYFSRSRNSIWFKGESSGNTQKIIKVEMQLNKNFFIYLVHQNLAACHEGYYSCYFRKITSDGNLLQIDNEKRFDSDSIYHKK